MLDEDEDAEDAKGVANRPLKRRRQEVFTIVEVSYEEAQSVEAPTGSLAKVGKGKAVSSFLDEIAELAQIGLKEVWEGNP